MIEYVIYFFTAFIAIGVVGQAGASGLLNGAFQRGFAGASAQIVSAKFLFSYTNFETFVRACLDGSIGLSGYVFLGSLGFLAAVWVNNLVEYRQAII